MVAAARTAGRVLDVAFNHRRRGDVQKLRELIEEGRLGPPLLHEGVVAAPHRHPDARVVVHAVVARGRRAAGRHRRARARLRAVPARQPGGQVGVARRPTTCSAPTGSAARAVHEDGRQRRREVRRRGPRHGLHAPAGRRHAAAGGVVGDAPRRRRPVRATIYGTEGGAEWYVDDYVPVGSLKLFGDIDGTPPRGPSGPRSAARTRGRRRLRRDDPLRRVGGARRQRGGSARARRRRRVRVGPRAARDPALVRAIGTTADSGGPRRSASRERSSPLRRPGGSRQTRTTSRRAATAARQRRPVIWPAIHRSHEDTHS